MPAVPSVIPDVFNRESRVFPKQGYANEGREKKTGFPLETCGNDRRGPDVPPLVIPDVSNRESKVFPKQGIHE